MIYLAADHRGFELKEKVKEWLKEWGEEFEDMGNEKYDKADDYPDFAKRVGKAVGEGKGKGVVVCGSGVGVNIVVNKFAGVRGFIGMNKEQVGHGTEWDHGNVLALASEHVNEEEAKEMVRVFIETEPSQAERNIRRVGKVKQIETGGPAAAGD